MLPPGKLITPERFHDFWMVCDFPHGEREPQNVPPPPPFCSLHTCVSARVHAQARTNQLSVLELRFFFLIDENLLKLIFYKCIFRLCIHVQSVKNASALI